VGGVVRVGVGVWVIVGNIALVSSWEGREVVVGGGGEV
jgi:hypothetical protein